MARSALFHHLQHLVALARFARAHGLRDPDAIRAAAAEARRGAAPTRRQLLAGAGSVLVGVLGLLILAQ